MIFKGRISDLIFNYEKRMNFKERILDLIFHYQKE